VNFSFENLEAALGYRFQDSRLTLQALTHKSYSNEQTDVVLHNERLEFLGDAVLELTVSDWVFRHFPDLPEGGLTRIRAEVVSEKGLSALARQLNIGETLLLGKGEERSGGRDKDSLLANALEALLGAVYYEGGFSAAYAVIEKVFAETIRSSAHNRYGTDYKTCLQERLQAGFGDLPEYQLVKASGPDHDRTFLMEVRFDGKCLGRGRGASKKRAEQQAAAAALDHPLVRDL
jgi:ribonuclease III